jgi:hypothetical protein
MVEKISLIILSSIYKCVVFSFGMFFLTGYGYLEAQVLKDTATLKLVKETVDQIYNMRFNDAGETTNLIRERYPEHPVGFLLNGMIIYWKNYPLLTGSDASRDFENQMRLCISKCENFAPENEAEFLLANLCARGGLLAFYTGNDLSSKAFSLGRTSYRYLMRSFEFMGTFPDFYYFTGLYNYYREAYPDVHPVYKPLFALFPRGDRLKGMNELRTAFKESIFLRAEASTFLSSNYKFFENDFVNALYFSRLIFNEYPLNIVYSINYIEDLLLNGKYDEAEKLIESPDSKTDNKYYQAQLTILRGILAEKKHDDLNRAEQEYLKGLENISGYGKYGNQYAAYAWFGLSRISGLNNDRHNQRIYRRKALDLTDFGNVNFDK